MWTFVVIRSVIRLSADPINRDEGTSAEKRRQDRVSCVGYLKSVNATFARDFFTLSKTGRPQRADAPRRSSTIRRVPCGRLSWTGSFHCCVLLFNCCHTVFLCDSRVGMAC